MDASAYAFAQGVRSTRSALRSWNTRPWPVLRGWVAGSVLAAVALLGAVWLIAALTGSGGPTSLHRPPFVVGDRLDVVRILGRNAPLLALHALACAAGFLARPSPPPPAEPR